MEWGEKLPQSLTTKYQIRFLSSSSPALSLGLLWINEPSIGLSPNYVLAIFDKLAEIGESGTTIFLVEQNARIALEYSHRAYVFGIGRIMLEGKSDELLKKDEVKRLFLGG